MRRRPVEPAPAVVSAAARPATLAASLVVEDQLEPRIRLPTDLLRCVTTSLEIAILVGLGLLAHATANGLQVDVVGASEHLARGLVNPLHLIAFVALLALPVGLAVRLAVIGQLRQLAEAVVIGLIAGGAAVACNTILSVAALEPLHRALARTHSPPGSATLDQYLTGLAAYLTVIGMAGRHRWRTWFAVAISFYCLTSLALDRDTTTVLSLLITLLLGSAIGSGLRYLAGTQSARPSAAEIARALAVASVPLTEIRRILDTRAEHRRYAAVAADGERLDVTVFDRDQEAANFLYRIYRGLRLSSQVSRGGPLTVNQAIERQALMSYAVEEAGVATPKLRAAARVGAEAAVIATRHCGGTTLADMPGLPSDAQIGRVFDAVLALHQHRVTHRALTPDNIALTGSQDGVGAVMLLDPSGGEVAASDLQLRLDLAQLTASMALLVGPERAVEVARRKLDPAVAAGLVPLLQPVVLHQSTRAALREHKDLLPALRKGLAGTTPEADIAASEQLERIRPRSVLTLVAVIVAGYVVIGQLGRENFVPVLRHSDWTWVLVGAALSAASYVCAAVSVTGFVTERLRPVRTFLAQLASSFVTLVAPAAVGGVALNIRYLHKSKVAPADAVSSIGVNQLFAFGLHLMLLVIFVALTGGTQHTPFRPPSWAYIALIALAAVAAAVFVVPAGRRLLRSRVAPALGGVIPRLLDLAQRPVKLVEGIGGALALSFSYILCLEASLRAVGGHASFITLAVVYLTGAALGSIVPTPGGLGAVEIAMSGGLTTIAHVPTAFALSAVLLYRLLTFWLPIPFGWAAMNYLQRHDAL